MVILRRHAAHSVDLDVHAHKGSLKEELCLCFNQLATCELIIKHVASHPGGGGGAFPFRIGREACPMFLNPKILSKTYIVRFSFLPFQVYIFGFSLD